MTTDAASEKQEAEAEEAITSFIDDLGVDEDVAAY